MSTSPQLQSTLIPFNRPRVHVTPADDLLFFSTNRIFLYEYSPLPLLKYINTNEIPANNELLSFHFKSEETIILDGCTFPLHPFIAIIGDGTNTEAGRRTIRVFDYFSGTMVLRYKYGRVPLAVTAVGNLIITISAQKIIIQPLPSGPNLAPSTQHTAHSLGLTTNLDPHQGMAFLSSHHQPAQSTERIIPTTNNPNAVYALYDAAAHTSLSHLMNSFGNGEFGEGLPSALFDTFSFSSNIPTTAIAHSFLCFPESPPSAAQDDPLIQGYKGFVGVLDLVTCQYTKTIPVCKGTIQFLKLSQDGHLLAVASDKGTLIRVFNTTTGGLLHTFRRGHNVATISAMAFSYSNELLAVASLQSKIIHIFKLSTSEFNDERINSISNGQVDKNNSDYFYLDDDDEENYSFSARLDPDGEIDPTLPLPNTQVPPTIISQNKNTTNTSASTSNTTGVSGWSSYFSWSNLAAATSTATNLASSLVSASTQALTQVVGMVEPPRHYGFAVVNHANYNANYNSNTGSPQFGPVSNQGSGNGSPVLNAIGNTPSGTGSHHGGNVNLQASGSQQQALTLSTSSSSSLLNSFSSITSSMFQNPLTLNQNSSSVYIYDVRVYCIYSRTPENEFKSSQKGPQNYRPFNNVPQAESQLSVCGYFLIAFCTDGVAYIYRGGKGQLKLIKEEAFMPQETPTQPPQSQQPKPSGSNTPSPTFGPGQTMINDQYQQSQQSQQNQQNQQKTPVFNPSLPSSAQKTHSTMQSTIPSSRRQDTTTQTNNSIANAISTQQVQGNPSQQYQFVEKVISTPMLQSVHSPNGIVTTSTSLPNFSLTQQQGQMGYNNNNIPNNGQKNKHDDNDESENVAEQLQRRLDSMNSNNIDINQLNSILSGTIPISTNSIKNQQNLSQNSNFQNHSSQLPAHTHLTPTILVGSHSPSPSTIPLPAQGVLQPLSLDGVEKTKQQHIQETQSRTQISPLPTSPVPSQQYSTSSGSSSHGTRVSVLSQQQSHVSLSSHGMMSTLSQQPTIQTPSQQGTLFGLLSANNRSMSGHNNTHNSNNNNNNNNNINNINNNTQSSNNNMNNSLFDSTCLDFTNSSSNLSNNNSIPILNQIGQDQNSSLLPPQKLAERHISLKSNNSYDTDAIIYPLDHANSDIIPSIDDVTYANATDDGIDRVDGVDGVDNKNTDLDFVIQHRDGENNVKNSGNVFDLNFELGKSHPISQHSSTSSSGVSTTPTNSRSTPSQHSHISNNISTDNNGIYDNTSTTSLPVKLDEKNHKNQTQINGIQSKSSTPTTILQQFPPPQLTSYTPSSEHIYTTLNLDDDLNNISSDGHHNFSQTSLLQPSNPQPEQNDLNNINISTNYVDDQVQSSEPHQLSHTQLTTPEDSQLSNNSSIQPHSQQINLLAHSNDDNNNNNNNNNGSNTIAPNIMDAKNTETKTSPQKKIFSHSQRNSPVMSPQSHTLQDYLTNSPHLQSQSHLPSSSHSLSYINNNDNNNTTTLPQFPPLVPGHNFTTSGIATKSLHTTHTLGDINNDNNNHNNNHNNKDGNLFDATSLLSSAFHSIQSSESDPHNDENNSPSEEQLGIDNDHIKLDRQGSKNIINTTKQLQLPTPPAIPLPTSPPNGLDVTSPEEQLQTPHTELSPDTVQIALCDLNNTPMDISPQVVTPHADQTIGETLDINMIDFLGVEDDPIENKHVVVDNTDAVTVKSNTTNNTNHSKSSSKKKKKGRR